MSKKEDKKKAIALHYDEESAPRVSAAGMAGLADEIITIAEAHGIPLRQDEELVTLLAQLDLGDAVPEELYLIVAEVLAFAYVVTGRFPKGWKPN